MRLGAGIGQAVAHVQVGRHRTPLTVSLERLDRSTRDILGDRYDLDLGLAQQPRYQLIGDRRGEAELPGKPY